MTLSPNAKVAADQPDTHTYLKRCIRCLSTLTIMGLNVRLRGFNIPVCLLFVYPSGKCKRRKDLSGIQETEKSPGE